jgi:hypothetical protein
MSEPNDMTCTGLADVAAELALGVLTGRERAMAVAHLDECDACREDVRHLMVTGEQLLELLPSAEPPAGFETRVLERLGLPVPARQDTVPPPASPPASPPVPPPASRRGNSLRRRKSTRTAPPARPGGTRRAGRMRRTLAAVAVGVAVIAAGLGGWRIGAGPSTSSAAGQLTTASLLSATRQQVGNIFLYSGTPSWLYMSVDDLNSGQQTVTCQVLDTDGRVTTIGSFQLTDGYGAWGSPAPGNVGHLSGARLVSANGTVLATATFSH